MTEDRANPVPGGGLGKDVQSLAGRRIGAILAVWRHGLKMVRNVPFGEFPHGDEWPAERRLIDGMISGSAGEKNPRTGRGFR